MKNAEEIKSRIEELENRIKEIEKASEKELEKPFFDRDPLLFRFLSGEKKIGLSALEELKWVLNE
jgi:hypothetical protein